MASEAGLSTLKKNYDLQISHSVNVNLLNPEQLKKQFPWLHVSDLAAGCLGISGEGWIDPYSLLMAFSKKAKDFGVIFHEDKVIEISLKGNQVEKVKTKKNIEFSGDFLVNAGGVNAAKIAGFVNISLPVQSRKRFVYTLECKEQIPECPLVIDPTGVYFRPEGDKFLCGVTPPKDQDPEYFDFKMDYSLFENMIWSVLAERVEYFAKIKRGFSWAGHYAYNTQDQNAIIGPHPEITNFLFANGFSGHGLQQAPAVGRAISELITFGNYRTLELSRFSFDRFESGELVRERNVV